MITPMHLCLNCVSKKIVALATNLYNGEHYWCVLHCHCKLYEQSNFNGVKERSQ